MQEALFLNRHISELSALLQQELAAAVPGSTVDIFLSSEAVATASKPEVLRVIRECSQELDLHWRVVIRSSSNASLSAKLLGAYMPLLVLGRLHASVLLGTPETFTAGMTLLIPGRSAVLITEVIHRSCDALASVIRDRDTLAGLQANFEDSLRSARPLMTAYDDHFIRNIVELFAEEYCTPGTLDVVKSGMNPMYYTPEEYGRILKKLGMEGSEYDWRMQYFHELNSGLPGFMRSSRSREVLSLSMLEKIVETGRCRMPGMYFMTSGIAYIDREDIAALLDDLIRYLEEYPDFHILLLAEDSLFSPNSCWHIKSSKHVDIHTWNIDAPVLVVSDRVLMIEEFQHYFDAMWERTATGTTNKDTIRELQRLRDKCLAGGKA